MNTNPLANTNPNVNTNPQWFALRVRSRSEKLTSSNLEGRGYEVCSACAPQRRVWADRVRSVEMPMFPGYIFARLRPGQASDVLQAGGVVSIVSFGGRYCPVEDAEVESVQRVVESGVEVLSESLRPGIQVRVVHGSLKGLEGVLVEVKNQRRLVVSVSLLQRAVAVEINDVMVEPVSNRPVSQRPAMISDAA
jgi:transcriptional antiterminator NusG